LELFHLDIKNILIINKSESIFYKLIINFNVETHNLVLEMQS